MRYKNDFMVWQKNIFVMTLIHKDHLGCVRGHLLPHAVV